MDITQAGLAATAVFPDQFPTDGRVEFAFAGKSNVGKSSLINAMVNRKALARASRQPGKTRTINFFSVEYKQSEAENGSSPADTDAARHSVYFVDLPGYGYAKVSKSESAKWGAMVEGYLKKRPVLKALLLLTDIRHEPTANDHMLYDWCRHYGLPVILVATKSDKLKRSQVPKYLAAIRRAYAADTTPIAFSSDTREGRDALWRALITNA